MIQGLQKGDVYESRARCPGWRQRIPRTVVGGMADCERLRSDRFKSRAQARRRSGEIRSMGWQNTRRLERLPEDRKSTRLNSSHGYISYAVFCLKKKNKYGSQRRGL